MLKENIEAPTGDASLKGIENISFPSNPHRENWQHWDVSCEDNKVHLSRFWLSLSLSTPLTRVCIVIRIDRASLCAWAVAEISAAEKCTVATWSTHTSESRWRPCALGSRRVEDKKACSSPSARAIFTHTWTSVSTYCLTHRDALAIRVTTRARREPRGYKCFLGVDLKGKKSSIPPPNF